LFRVDWKEVYIEADRRIEIAMPENLPPKTIRPAIAVFRVYPSFLAEAPQETVLREDQKGRFASRRRALTKHEAARGRWEPKR